ncbi:MAG: DUF5777 family beta-barrel protein [Bacteroidota bacterium]
MNHITLTLVVVVVSLTGLFGQNYAYQTFKDRRVINTQSVETLPARTMDIRIAHRFGDFAGRNGGEPTFFGLEFAEDVAIGAEYGITDNLMVGFHRSKGAGVVPNGPSGLRQLWTLNGKYRVLRQTDLVPITITLSGMTTFSSAQQVEVQPDDAPSIIQNFPEFGHRFAHNVQLLIARKFSPAFSLQIIPSYTHRNLVAFNDENGIFSMGVATRVQISKVFGIVADATFPFSDFRTSDNNFYPAIGIGLEMETGGHVFQVNFTNATAIMETDYIPYTTSNWLEGQYRLGFTISRQFRL